VNERSAKSGAMVSGCRR